MKQLNLTLLMLAVFATSAFAQVSPTKSFKNAKKRLFSYYSAPAKNTDKLQEAKDFIDAAITGISEIKEKDHAKVYKTGGEVYLEVAKNATLKAKYTDAGEKCMDYLFKTSEHPNAKKSQKDFARVSLEELGGTIFIQEGNTALGAAEWSSAQKAFENVLKCKTKVDELGTTLNFLLLESQQDFIRFYTGYSAYNAKDYEATKKHLEPLAEKKFDESFVYSFLSSIYLKEENDEKAVAIINKGVEALSNFKINDQLEGEEKKKEEERISEGLKRLLFAKINYFLTAGKLGEAEDDLKKAMEQEPDNASLPFTLGQVYESLANKAFGKENDEEGQKYFDEAIKLFDKTISIKPDYFDAIYQAGALYFNEAVRLNKIQANLDYKSPTYKKDFDAMETKLIPLYEKAWDYFKKAEQIKPSDLLLIKAFKSTYLRAKQNDAFAEFSKREKALDAEPTTKFEPFAHPASLFN